MWLPSLTSRPADPTLSTTSRTQDAAMFLRHRLEPLVKKAKALARQSENGGEGGASKRTRRLSASGLLMNLVGINSPPLSPIEAKVC